MTERGTQLSNLNSTFSQTWENYRRTRIHGGISLKRTSYSIKATSRRPEFPEKYLFRLSAAFTVGLGTVPGVTGWTDWRNVRGTLKLTSCSTCPGSSNTSVWTQNTSLRSLHQVHRWLNHQKAYDSQRMSKYAQVSRPVSYFSCSHWGTCQGCLPSRK